MAEELETLKEALVEFRSRPRAFLLHRAMVALELALPAAFDPANEKKNGPYEKEAYNVHRDCEAALRGAASPVASAQATQKRESEAWRALKLSMIGLKRSIKLLMSRRKRPLLLKVKRV